MRLKERLRYDIDHGLVNLKRLLSDIRWWLESSIVLLQGEEAQWPDEEDVSNLVSSAQQPAEALRAVDLIDITSAEPEAIKRIDLNFADRLLDVGLTSADQEAIKRRDNTFGDRMRHGITSRQQEAITRRDLPFEDRLRDDDITSAEPEPIKRRDLTFEDRLRDDYIRHRPYAIRYLLSSTRRSLEPVLIRLMDIISAESRQRFRDMRLKDRLRYDIDHGLVNLKRLLSDIRWSLERSIVLLQEEEAQWPAEEGVSNLVSYAQKFTDEELDGLPRISRRPAQEVTPPSSLDGAPREDPYLHSANELQHVHDLLHPQTM